MNNQIFLGIDLGTSGVSIVAINQKGNYIGNTYEEYDFLIPFTGAAEQDPKTWWLAISNATKRLLSENFIRREEVKAISFSGQMHGLIPIDKKGEVVRNAIIWCDQRSQKQVDYILEEIGEAKLGEMTGNAVDTGFMLASLLWIKDLEPGLFDKIDCVLTPKDYLRFLMTGDRGIDYSDASGTLLFDCFNKCWSNELIKIFNLPYEIFPKVCSSTEFAGKLNNKSAFDMGLTEDVNVYYGAADQVAQAIGNGVIESDTTSLTIGTGGQLLLPINTPILNPDLNTNMFHFYDSNTWFLMGVCLSAGLSYKWLKNNFFPNTPYKELDEMASHAKPGSDGLVFIPYLIGDRMNKDTNTRGSFLGLTINHNSSHIVRSVLEGVIFSMRQALEIFHSLHQNPKRIVASGGGAKSKLWLQIQADILGENIFTSETIEEAGTGAAIIASVGYGIYPDIKSACGEIVKFSKIPIVANQENHKAYTEIFNVYKNYYDDTKQMNHLLADFSEKCI